MKIVIHQEDLATPLTNVEWVSVDTETLGLNPLRDRLCLIQLYAGGDTCHLVQFDPTSTYKAPHLKAVLENPNIIKLFHFARFDLMMIKKYLGIQVNPIYCTKIASKITRTYTDKHSLKDLCGALLGVEISKQEQASDWGRPTLTESQKQYAASDVLYLHALKEKLDIGLEREGRTRLAEECFKFLPTCVNLDLLGWEMGNLFAH